MIEKVNENMVVESYECMRCSQYQCTGCNRSVEIDFEIDTKKDFSDGEGEGIPVSKGDEICPFCYNQLVDKFPNNKNGK